MGRLLVTILSSIWVTDHRHLAAARESSIARFCTSGTCSRGSSTPRSPRATMMPSNVSMIADR